MMATTIVNSHTLPIMSSIRAAVSGFVRRESLDGWVCFAALLGATQAIK